jgi:hypothetical protein
MNDNLPENIVTGRELMDNGTSVIDPSEVINTGGTMVRSQTHFHTAISRMKPRKMDNVVANIMEEAAHAGASWYYRWKVKSKRGRESYVEGGTIGLAYALYREWGNCALDINHEISNGYVTFTANFVDLEKCTSLPRQFRMKFTPAVGDYADARWEDIQFQIAQSKASRNVILAAIPKWIKDAAIARANKSEISSIEKAGLAESRQKVIDFFSGYGVEVDQLESHLNKIQKNWTASDIADFKGIAESIRSGEIRASDVFDITDKNKPESKPDPKPEKDEPKKRQPKKKQESKKSEPKKDTPKESDPEPSQEPGHLFDKDEPPESDGSTDDFKDFLGFMESAELSVGPKKFRTFLDKKYGTTNSGAIPKDKRQEAMDLVEKEFFSE